MERIRVHAHSSVTVHLFINGEFRGVFQVSSQAFLDRMNAHCVRNGLDVVYTVV